MFNPFRVEVFVVSNSPGCDALPGVVQSGSMMFSIGNINFALIVPIHQEQLTTGSWQISAGRKSRFQNMVKYKNQLITGVQASRQ